MPHEPERCLHPVDTNIDGVCGAPVFKRSYCLHHYGKFYQSTKPKDLTVIADLSSPPWGRIGRATKW